MGDSAYPMAPGKAAIPLILKNLTDRNLNKYIQGGGGSMAGEDAAALGILLSHVTSASEVKERLALYSQLRVKRVAEIQIFSTRHQWDPSKLSKGEALYFDGKCPGEAALMIPNPVKGANASLI